MASETSLVELHSLTENIDTTTPTGKLTFHIFAALAEFERDILRQRVNAGLKAARRRGRLGGRPKSLTEADLKKARALLRSGDYTKGQVADELKVARHTLWRALLGESRRSIQRGHGLFARRFFVHGRPFFLPANRVTGAAVPI